MKVLLKDAGTGSYVGRETAWAENVAGAAEFGTVDSAVQKALEYARNDVVVVLRYEDPVCELGLNPAFCGADDNGRGERLRA